VNWTPVATNLAATNGIIFSAPKSSNYPASFYRAMQQ
jgi:hypothetical protein